MGQCYKCGKGPRRMIRWHMVSFWRASAARCSKTANDKDVISFPGS